MKMIGISHSSSLSLACSSRPDIFDMRMSAITHAARLCRSDPRNSPADPKHRATSPADSNKSRSESQIDSSSSMMAINLDVWHLGMAQTRYIVRISHRTHLGLLQGERGVNETVVILRSNSVKPIRY